MAKKKINDVVIIRKECDGETLSWASDNPGVITYSAGEYEDPYEIPVDFFLETAKAISENKLVTKLRLEFEEAEEKYENPYR